ncbi:MAG: 4-amino-4-deoxy-L-arabinose transferase [Actinomycetes bacterium]
MPNPTIGELVAALRAAPARCGLTRVVLIDGPAGAGKSTLANRLAVALGGTASGGAGTYDPAAPLPDDAPVQIVHGDDMYEGWSGLATLDRVLLDEILLPLARGEAGAFRMWDWIADRRTHDIAVPPRPFLLVEGVGVAQRRARELASIVVWVEAPWEVRLARGLERDGEHMRAEWERWEAEQNAHHAREATRSSADAVVDGTRPVPD